MTDKKAEIYRCGKELFIEKGFKDTGVADIMQRAGFAVGTFYRYYPSKDHLFMEIYNQENVALKRAILDSADPRDDPLTLIREMMRRNVQGMQANPILKEWFNREVFHKIEQRFRETNAIEHVDFFYDCFIEVVRNWQREGRMRRDIDAEMIMAIFTAFINIDLHKDEIGIQYFPELMEHLGDFIMKGLMQSDDRDAGGARNGNEP